MKRFAALLILVTMILVPMPVWGNTSESGAGTHPAGTSFVDANLEYPEGVSTSGGKLRLQSVSTKYPEDGNYKSYATPVKDQGDNGLCWDFAATAVMETALKKSGRGNYDLSESHMAYAMSNHGGNKYGYNRAPSGGGNAYQAAAYMMRGMPSGDCAGGMVQEKADPYSTELLKDRSSSVTLRGKQKVVMPENIIFINSKSTDSNTMTKVKNAIRRYGSVGASYYSNSSYYNWNNGAYYQNLKGSEGTNHEVQIVGWDDEYSRYNFKSSCRPASDGAWIVKNSYGTYYGKSGYFFISYCDKSFPTTAYAIDGVREYNSNVVKTYEYDYTETYESCYKVDNSNTGLMMRTFVAESDEVVTDVAVYIGSAYGVTEADIMTDCGNKENFKFSTKGSILTDYPGWYTIKLDVPVLVRKGQTFGAVIRSDAFIKVNSEDTRGSAYCRNGKWYTASSNSKQDAWCIKARTSSEASLVKTYIDRDNREKAAKAAATKPAVKESVSLKPVKIKKPKTTKKSTTIRWAKLSKKARKSIKNVEIQFSPDKSFRTGVKRVIVKSKKSSKKIGKLAKGRKYYVRVRAYTKAGNTIRVSKWSSVKSFKAK